MKSPSFLSNLWPQRLGALVLAAAFGIAAPAAPADEAASRKVTINNKIRQWVRHYVAENALFSSNAAERKAAMEQMLQKNDAGALQQVQAALPKESNSGVRELMQAYIARADLQSADVSRHAAAIAVLGKSALPQNPALLQNYVQTASTPELKAQAKKAVSAIETKQSLLKGAETLSFGLSPGSVLVLTAIGLAITFGVMGVINMAHGELIMIGAYCAYVVQLCMPNHIGWSIAAAFVVSGFVGVLIERFVVRYLYGRPLETLLATFGISLILQQLVRSVFSPLNRMVQSPEWMGGAWQIMPGLSITWNRVYIFVFCLPCFFALLAVMKRTRPGLEVRAVSQNRHMARAMGISDRKVDMLTFGLGSGIAGVAGVALSQLTNVGPNLGQQYIVDPFMVVVGVAVLAVYGLLRNIMNSRLGKLVIAVRDAEMRVRFTGFRVEHVKLLVFVISAMIAGLAGALYVPQVGIINPSEFAPLASIEIIIRGARRPRHALRRDYRRICGELHQNLAYRRLSRCVVILPRRLVCVGNHLPERRRGRACGAKAQTGRHPAAVCPPAAPQEGNA